MSEQWKPTAGIRMLRHSEKLRREVRRYFYEAGFLEVDPPILSRAGTPELHVESLRVPEAFPDGATGWLVTSPEFHLKRMLAAGSGNVYTLGKVFRKGEAGRLHNPEFTLLEWYREGASLEILMDEIVAILARMLPAELLSEPTQKISYRDACLQCCALDPFTATVQELQETLQRAESFTRSELLDLVVAEKVYPQLGRHCISLVYHFPADQASLARICPSDSQVADRVEAVVSGIELVNGFVELTDPIEQRNRFLDDLACRSAGDREVPPLDSNFLRALEAGLPPCAGAALGFDRVAMLAAGARGLSDILPFPQERA